MKQIFDLDPDDGRPSIDFIVVNHGNVFTFTPMTVRAEDWWQDHVQNGAKLGGSYAVEHRMVEPIMVGAKGAGLIL